MAYRYQSIKPADQEVDYVYINQGELSAPLTQYEILDDYGDQIAVVLSETEAESLVSHLNR